MRGEGSPAEIDPARIEEELEIRLRSEEERITAEMNALQERLGDLAGLMPFQRRSSVAARPTVAIPPGSA